LIIKFNLAIKPIHQFKHLFLTDTVSSRINCEFINNIGMKKQNNKQFKLQLQILNNYQCLIILKCKNCYNSLEIVNSSHWSLSYFNSLDRIIKKRVFYLTFYITYLHYNIQIGCQICVYDK